MRFTSLLIIVSFIVLIVSFWNRNDLPGSIDYLPEIFDEPKQTATHRKPFGVTYKDIDYLIEPEYEYDLVGMVVSYRHHDGKSRMHLRSNDKLNMLDVCVIWGDNATNSGLHKIEFWNGIFTCNVSTRDQAAWDAFDMYQLSNNHLISDDEFIRDQVGDVRIGDQIRVRGYLAAYSSEGGSKRGTSTTRLDTGDGACETLFVEQFDIVRASRSYWRWSMYASTVILLVGLFVHFRRPYKPYRSG